MKMKVHSVDDFIKKSCTVGDVVTEILDLDKRELGMFLSEFLLKKFVDGNQYFIKAQSLFLYNISSNTTDYISRMVDFENYLMRD